MRSDILRLVHFSYNVWCQAKRTMHETAVHHQIPWESGWSQLHTYRKTTTKHENCVEDFSQCFVQFVKRVFCVSCFTQFLEEGCFSLKKSRNGFFYVDCKKENCVKCKKYVEVILSSFRVPIIFHEMTSPEKLPL